MINTIFNKDCIEGLKQLPAGSVQTCVTSPPYFGLRDYGTEGQIGLEATPQEFVTAMVTVFREVRRVLRDDGTLWLNLGDSYARQGSDSYQVGKNALIENQIKGRCKRLSKPPEGPKHKDLVGIPWRVAFALQEDGWYLRQDIIWHKPNPMPESVTDRCTKSHEYIFLLSKKPMYYFDSEAIKEDSVTAGEVRGGGKRYSENAVYGYRNDTQHLSNYGATPSKRNKRDVWSVAVKPCREAHFATFPHELIRPCILAGTSQKGHCPECGSIFERQINRIPATSKPCPKTQAAHEARGGTGEPVGTVGKSGGGRIDGYTQTLGWKPTCSCGLNPEPDIVLDVFMGSGTTAIVSKEEGRNYVGFELNPEYIAIAERRLSSVVCQPHLI